MPNLKNAYDWAINKCNAPKIGYSQSYRNEQTVNGVTYYDCSSFIWYALKYGGFDVEGAYRTATGENYSGNAIWTAVERDWLTALGFVSLPISGEWKAGDVLWRQGHTEMVYIGGIGRGRTMGAHNAKVALKDQVSINDHYSTADSWTSIYRYGGGGILEISKYVIAAICGNWKQESTINPGLWEGLTPGTWTDLRKGYGLGQWTNTDDSQGRLYHLHEYLTANGYSDDSAEGQVNYLMVENIWYPVQEASAYRTLTDFLNSQSTNLTDLTHAFCIGWEGIHDSSWDTRVTYAQQCYDYIVAHATDPAITTWYSGNRYLSDAEVLNNAVMFYRLFQGLIPPTPTPTPPSNDKMPVWLMLKYY